MAIRKTSLSGTPETSITFYSVGGHSHDGISSSLIDTSKYSIFDFNPSLVGNDRNRRSLQDTNFNSFKTFIINTVNESVLSPAGVVLAPNSIGAANIVSNSITANELAANIVLVDNVIRSSNYSNLTGFESGWLIANTGNAEFNNVTIRGAITSSTVDIPNTVSNNSFHIGSNGSIWSGSNTANFSSANFSVTSSGALKSLTGRIGPFAITESSLVSNGYSPRNYIKIENYGDITIYSNPDNGPHSGMIHETNLVGEYIFVGRTNDTVNRYATMGSITGDPNKISFEIVQNNASKFKADSNGDLTVSRDISASKVSATTVSGTTVSGTNINSSSLLTTYKANITNNLQVAVNLNLGDNPAAGPNYPNSSCIEIQTDTNFGGVYDAHTGYAIYSRMSGGWGLAELNFQCSNGWGTYKYNPVAFTITQAAIYANGYEYASDKSLKQNITDCQYGLNEIKQLYPKNYTLIQDTQITTIDGNQEVLEPRMRTGLIAQEVLEILPNVVTKRNEDSYYSLDYNMIIPVLINAVKELSNKIDNLESRFYDV